MTIIKDGEKFACKQCIQGHRVSTCQHEDRPLLHVARKGRPVSQCIHCRGLRKVRQTHIKCDCGERRHSRNNSNESNTLCASDDNSCHCGSGKKCTCALKKEGHSDSRANHSPKSHSVNRRSESAVPRSRNTYQPNLQRNFGSGEYTAQYQMPQSPLSRGHHGTQRSVDSLPMLNSGISFNASPTNHTSHLYAPSPITSQRGLSNQFLSVNDDFRNFNVPLDQNVLDRTLSPQNPKRYSMNDWSMMAFTGTGQDQGPSYFADTATVESRPFWRAGWNMSSADTPPTLATANFNDGAAFHGQPDLSTSSSATISDFGEVVWQDRAPSFSSMQPTITIEPSPCQPTFVERNALSWTPATYQEGPSEFVLSNETVPSSSLHQQSQSGDNYSETSGFVDPTDFSFHGSKTNGSPLTEMHFPLVDRSVSSQWGMPLDMHPNSTFKFPQTNNNGDLEHIYLSQSVQVDQKDWLVQDDQQYLDLIEAHSPMSIGH